MAGAVRMTVYCVRTMVGSVRTTVYCVRMTVFRVRTTVYCVQTRLGVCGTTAFTGIYVNWCLLGAAGGDFGWSGTGNT